MDQKQKGGAQAASRDERSLPGRHTQAPDKSGQNQLVSEDTTTGVTDRLVAVFAFRPGDVLRTLLCGLWSWDLSGDTSKRGPALKERESGSESGVSRKNSERTTVTETKIAPKEGLRSVAFPPFAPFHFQFLSQFALFSTKSWNQKSALTPRRCGWPQLFVQYFSAAHSSNIWPQLIDSHSQHSCVDKSPGCGCHCTSQRSNCISRLHSGPGCCKCHQPIHAVWFDKWDLQQRVQRLEIRKWLWSWNNKRRIKLMRLVNGTLRQNKTERTRPMPRKIRHTLPKWTPTTIWITKEAYPWCHVRCAPCKQIVPQSCPVSPGALLGPGALLEWLTQMEPCGLIIPGLCPMAPLLWVGWISSVPCKGNLRIKAESWTRTLLLRTTDLERKFVVHDSLCQSSLFSCVTTQWHQRTTSRMSLGEPSLPGKKQQFTWHANENLNSIFFKSCEGSPNLFCFWFLFHSTSLHVKGRCPLLRTQPKHGVDQQLVLCFRFRNFNNLSHCFISRYVWKQWIKCQMFFDKTLFECGHMKTTCTLFCEKKMWRWQADHCLSFIFFPLNSKHRWQSFFPRHKIQEMWSKWARQEPVLENQQQRPTSQFVTRKFFPKEQKQDLQFVHQ